MGLCNIQNPSNPELYRCWSTYVDNWITDWMPYKEYREYLIERARKEMEERIDTFGIELAHSLTAEKCDAIVARKERCEKCEHHYQTEFCDKCDVWN